jgi:hypothetical protein
MSWEDSQDEQRKFNHIEEVTPICKSLGIPAPAYIEGEKFEHQRKRIIEKLRPYVSDELQRVKENHIFGTALDHVEKQYMESARAEAIKPTRVADGTLKEVISYDAAGRPSYSYFGKCSTWLSDFSSPAKKLIGIRGDGSRFVKP